MKDDEKYTYRYMLVIYGYDITKYGEQSNKETIIHCALKKTEKECLKALENELYFYRTIKRIDTLTRYTINSVRIEKLSENSLK